MRAGSRAAKSVLETEEIGQIAFVDDTTFLLVADSPSALLVLLACAL